MMELNIVLPIRGTESEVAGMISATSNMNTVRDSSTVMPEKGRHTLDTLFHQTSLLLLNCDLRELKINAAGCLQNRWQKLWIYFWNIYYLIHRQRSTVSFLFSAALSHGIAFWNKLAFSGPHDYLCCINSGAFVHLLRNRIQRKCLFTAIMSALA